jgi:ABC-type glycerol-3-phosphate transport system substrate-binding protein
MLIRKFPEVNFISKTVDSSNTATIVKTAFSAGEAHEIVGYWPNVMQIFTESNMALDLTPYLDRDSEWRNSFIPGTLDAGKYDGKYFNIPISSVYSLLQVNVDIFRRAGVTVKENWTWDEFLDACRRIRAYNPDIFPVGINSGWACWFPRNGLYHIWNTKAEEQSFSTGNISFTDPRIKSVFDNVKALYDNRYMYPGEGALTATNDQVLSAFARGRVAIMPNVNSIVGQTTREVVAGAFETTVIGWPSMGNNKDIDYVCGNSDGYFITSNTKYPDKAVEVLKYLTSMEMMQLRADHGVVVPSPIRTNDPNYSLYSRDLGRMPTTEIINVSAELFDYIVNSLPANYILYGDQSIRELEALRLAVRNR